VKKILGLVGPTASGKTQVAFELSKYLPLEVISCDSMQVYKSMPILTQAPPRALTRKLKTHFVNFLPPSKESSAAFFRERALSLIPKILKKGKIPLLVGGTGLYARALLDGLFEGGEKNEALRKKLISEQQAQGGNFLYDKLKSVDPAAAAKIHPNDIRRVVRALEIFYLTGRPFSDQKHRRQGIRGEYECRIFLLNPDRQELYRRIEKRVDGMIREGLVEEVRKLLKKNLSLTARMALGLREMQEYLSGEYSLEQAVELLKKHTRHYAKRQLSWFRHEPGVEVVDVGPRETAKQIAEKIYLKVK
jgi:tRNA dimethylallyltransferase